jgi:methylated-DNA-protein-cysteine methyltransferase related protein
VASYGQVAGVAGSPLAARQVVRVLHALSTVERLPWHRVINGAGSIALLRGAGFEEQRDMLRAEGVRVQDNGKVDMKKHRWAPRLSIAP